MPVATQVNRGQAVRLKGDVCVITALEHRTPGKGNACVQATLRNLRTGSSTITRWRSSEQVDIVPMARKRHEFSYTDAEGYHFIDPDSYEDVVLRPDAVEAEKDYLTENMSVDVVFIEEKPTGIELPPSVELKVTNSPEGIKGDSASNVQKPAEVETGLSVQVPLFIKEGDVIKISTADGKYLGRV